MNSSKIIPMIAVIAFMILLIFPIPSMTMNNDFVKLPTRHKRWTFNTWRLHGRRQLSHDLYSPKTSDNHNHYGIFNKDDNITHKIHERLSQILRELDRK